MSIKNSCWPVLKPALLVLLALLIAAPRPAHGQGPAEPWRTLHTEHFRIHYPAASEAWAQRAASRIEAVRAAVVAEVGYAPPRPADVLIMDPAAQANGSAWAIQAFPRMVLWTSPPGPASVIGHYRDWGELLVVHEDVHLVHLLRPSRNPWQRLSERLVPFGPISHRAPRWLTEGYATYLEGRLTGSGRPHSDLRAVILRRWAQLGELPSYGRVSADSQSWFGMSMAYLVGSAYLEWLVERTGPDSLRQLWARMSARQVRTFEAAFAGVFGDSPAKLYNRFRAELTYRAMSAELATEPHLEAGELWQDLSWSSGAPEISPDGEKLAIVRRSNDGPARLVVWSTLPDTEAEDAWQEARERLLELDAEDVPAVRRKPLPREPLFELIDSHGARPRTPRWLPGSEALLYVRYETDAQGFLHPDLFRWRLDGGQVERLTHGADLREPDPAPDGTWAVAVRQRHGLSQLVRVDLEHGAGEHGDVERGGIEELTAPTVDTVYHRPCVDPSGRRIAYARHRDGAWRLVVRTLEDESQSVGVETVLPAEPSWTTLAYPAWSADGQSIFAAVGEGGHIDIRRFDVATGVSQRVTRSHGATLAPAPTPDGETLFFLRFEADGMDLASLALTAEPVEPPVELAADTAEAERGSSLAPAVRLPPPANVPTFAEQALEPSRPYGTGRLELLPLLSGSIAAEGSRWEAGVRVGDVIGRLDSLALISGGEAFEGGALAVAWRGGKLAPGMPLTLGARLFALEQRPSERAAETGPGRQLDLEQRGLELTALWSRQRRGGVDRLALGAVLAEIEPRFGSATLDQTVGWLQYERRSSQRLGAWRFGQQLDARFDWGRTDGDAWRRFGGRLGATVGRRGGSQLAVSWQRRWAEDAILPFDRLQLGGALDSIQPRAIHGARIGVPALPLGTLLGDDYEGQRFGLRVGGWPVTLFYERHRLWASGQSRGDWLALRGAELRLRRGPMPLLRLPAFELHIGVAEILDEPLRDEWEGWLSLSWSP
ncbi:MAG: hypothetical protein AAF560_15935 [Acidobacteriota bacterium]